MRPLQQQLGDELRRLRKARNLKQVEVADEVGMSDPTLSRLERGATQRPDLHDVMNLLDLYQASKADRTRITELAQRSSDRTVRKAAGDIGSRQRTHAEMETVAQEIHEYQPGVVPALLQAPAYAKVRTRALQSLIPDLDDVAEMEALERRQQALSRKKRPLRYEALIDEAVLRRNHAPPSAMVQQRLRLVELAARPNVDIRVIPLQARAEKHFAAPTGFAIYQVDTSKTVAVETLTSDIYLHDAGEVAAYEIAYRRLRGAALSARKSADLINEIQDAR